MRGRPPKAKRERMVLLQVMVPPDVKRYIQKAARVQEMTLSAKVREILNSYWEGR